MGRRSLCLLLFAVCLCRTAAAAPEQWIEIRSLHFTVITDAGEKNGRHILDQFERMRWVFQTLFPKANVDPAEPIVVVAAKNQKVFDTLEPAAYQAKGQIKLGGLYLHTPDKNYILLRLDAQYEHPFANVYHEYTHVQFEGDAEWMPLWLNEGLAEFMQNTDIHDKNVEFGQSSIDDIRYLRAHALIPVDVLFKVDANSPYYHQEEKGSVFYAESWALTHYLIVTDGLKHTQMLENYMTLLIQKEDPVTAAEKAFGNLKQLQAALTAYIERGEYRIFPLSSAAAPLDDAPYKLRPLTAIEADTAKADVLAYVGRGNDARTLLESVLKADPGNAQANDTMGFLAFQAQDREQARQWYEKAVKLDSQDYLAHYYFAALSMSEPDAARNDAIAENLRTAIRLNPRFAPAYDCLAAFYLMKRDRLDEAHVLNSHAIELDPGNVAYRMNAASVLMAMQRYPDAINVLKIAEKVARTPDEIARVQQRIESIEEYEAARAREETIEKKQAEAIAAARADAQPTGEAAAFPQGPKHPTAPLTGRKHIAAGVIRGVTCSYPSVVEFRVEMAAGKTVSLYNNDFFKIDLTTLGAAPHGSMNPCTDFEGRKAEVQYVDSPDKTVDGQAVAVQLRK